MADRTERPSSPDRSWFAGKLLDERLDSLAPAGAEDPDGERRRRIGELLRAVVPYSPDSMVTLTLDGRLLFVSRQRDEEFGAMRDGAAIWDYLPAVDWPRVRACLDRVVETREPSAYESSVATSSGQVVHFETRIGPIVVGDRVVALAMVSSDVTRWRQQDIALRESEEKLRFAVEASGMGVWTYDVATETLEVDARLAAFTGVPAGRHGLAELASRVPREDRRSLRLGVRRCVETGTFPDIEHRVLRTDQPPAWIHTKGRAIRDASGVVTRIVGGSFDVTAQVEEAELREQTLKLQAVGQLAAGVAHNFNNALASMQLNLEVGLRRCPEDVQPLLRDAIDVGQRAAKLVRDLLRFAGRGGRGDVRELERLDELAERVTSLCRQTFPRSVGLETSCATDLPRVPLAIAPIEQLLLNLLINAQHALEDVEREQHWVRVGVAVLAGDHPEVRREGVAPASSCLRLRVEDNGCGMSDATLPRIFEPFFSTKEPGRGAGLGLASVYSTARDHGGWVTCTSRLGEGSTFSVYLPIRGRVVEADEPPSPALP